MKKLFGGIACLFIFILFFSLPSFAIDGVIRSIDVVGNVRTPKEAVISKLSSKVGTELDRDVIRQDIESLYKLGQFQDIKVETDQKADGLHVMYTVVELPIISSISFEGNRKIKDEDLEEVAVIRTYRPLDENEVALAIEKLRKKYADKGYYLADITYHVEPAGDGETKLVFDITEHQQIFIRRVYFTGNKVFSDNALRKVMRTKQKGPFSFMSGSGKYEEAKLNFDKTMLLLHYLNHGYLKAKVSPAKATISKDKRYLFLTFDIHEGEKYKLGTIDMDGDILTTKEELLSLLKTKSGNIYSQQKIEEDVELLADRYGDEGYAYANIYPRVESDDETHIANITFTIEKGKRITIERINISGNDVTRDKVIRRELKLVEQDRYSERSLKESRQRLYQLGFFEEVNFATPRGSDDETVNLDITVKERPTGTFNIGAGFSTVENFIFNASVQKQNFFGYGVGGQLSLELSKRRQLFTLEARDPYFLDSDWSAGFSVYRNAYLFNDFRRTSSGGSLNFGHRFFDHFSADLGYQLEQVDVSDFSFAVPQLFRANSSGRTSALSLTVARDTRDNRLLASKGSFHVVTAEVTDSAIGGTNEFYRINYKAHFYQPIWKGIVFKSFGRMGYIKSLNDGAVPLYERMFLGGPYSLRGFFPNSVGPKLRIPVSPSGGDADFVYGGDKLLLGIAELELPIVNAAGLKAVSFFDIGNTFSEEENYSLARLRADYGFGLRWNSPMGP
ncbi:MAG: outer membrane protein assembly factor BamA, partial [Deltaproteobacteria bacterium]|nr:outer membrane protein assembly factor BamA [Deltaproteobacteria bacterium]